MQMMKEPQFEIVRASDDDHERIRVFLGENYYPYEPINMAMGLDNGHSPAYEAHLLDFVKEGTSLLAVETTQGTLLGVCINGAIFNDENVIEMASNCACERHAKFLWFVETVDRCSGFWNRVAVRRALSCEALAVVGSARGLGIGKALLQKTLQVAKDDGFPLLRVDCSSYYSAKLAEQMGLECIYSLLYSEYRSEDGYQIFYPPIPHVEFKMFIHKFL
jgi:GNAT superfamily N-acetyltransferase